MQLPFSFAFQMLTEEVKFLLWADWSRVNKRIECCFPKKEICLVFLISFEVIRFRLQLCDLS